MRVWEFQFSYDDEGQLQAKAATTFEFNYDHRLKQINGTQTAQFFYDVSGNRLKAIRGGVETRYIYDLAGNLLAEADVDENELKEKIDGIWRDYFGNDCHKADLIAKKIIDVLAKKS